MAHSVETSLPRSAGALPGETSPGPVRSIDSREVDRSPHGVEREIRRILAMHPGLSVNNLVVRRVRDGVCLTGVVESTGDDPDVCRLLQEVDGVAQVYNRLLVHTGGRN